MGYIGDEIGNRRQRDLEVKHACELQIREWLESFEKGSAVEMLEVGRCCCLGIQSRATSIQGSDTGGQRVHVSKAL
jgi:hypothetical protein